MTVWFVTCILSSKSMVLANSLLKQTNCRKNALPGYIATINFYGAKYLRTPLGPGPGPFTPSTPAFSTGFCCVRRHTKPIIFNQLDCAIYLSSLIMTSFLRKSLEKAAVNNGEQCISKTPSEKPEKFLLKFLNDNKQNLLTTDFEGKNR